MKISLRNFNGFFQVDYHTRFVRLLWMLSIPLSLSIITFGVWAIVVDFFDLTQSLEPKNFKIALIIFLTLALPALGLIIGSAKVRQKPGVHLRGIGFTNSGIEFGTLTVDIDTVGPKNILEKINSGDILEGNWTHQKTIKNKATDILIVLRTGCDPTRHIFFERVVISSGEEILYQLIGNNNPENRCEDLVAVSNGSFQLLADYKGIPPDQLLQFLGLAADIISTFRPSPPPSCTLAIAPSLATRGSVLAYGVLGVFNTARVNSPGDKEPLENIFDKNFTKSLRKFLKEREWIFTE